MNADAILERLLRQGKITEADLIDVGELTNDFKNTVKVVHALFERPDAAAGFHKEEQMAGAWEMPHHQIWIKNTRKILELLKINNEELQKIINSAVQLNRNLPRENADIILDFFTAFHEKTPIVQFLADLEDSDEATAASLD